MFFNIQSGINTPYWFMSIGELRTHKTIDESDGIFTQNTGLPSSFLSVNHISNSFEKNGKSGNFRKKERKLNALKLYSRIPLNNIYVPNKYKYIIADGSKGEQPGDLYRSHATAAWVDWSTQHQHYLQFQVAAILRRYSVRWATD